MFISEFGEKKKISATLKIYKQIMAENALSRGRGVEKVNKSTFQAALSLKQYKSKKYMQRHIIIKFQKIKDKLKQLQGNKALSVSEE